MSWLNTYGYKRAENKRFIQKALDKAGVNLIKVAALAGVSPQTVSATLNGYCHSPKVFSVLRDCKVPEELLFDPHTPAPKQETA